MSSAQRAAVTSDGGNAMFAQDARTRNTNPAATRGPSRPSSMQRPGGQKRVRLLPSEIGNSVRGRTRHRLRTSASVCSSIRTRQARTARLRRIGGVRPRPTGRARVVLTSGMEKHDTPEHGAQYEHPSHSHVHHLANDLTLSCGHPSDRRDRGCRQLQRYVSRLPTKGNISGVRQRGPEQLVRAFVPSSMSHPRKLVGSRELVRVELDRHARMTFSSMRSSDKRSLFPS